ncbi:MAG: hypothetical protein OCC49_15390 [Fibrobacterales bacterium]
MFQDSDSHRSRLDHSSLENTDAFYSGTSSHRSGGGGGGGGMSSSSPAASSPKSSESQNTDQSAENTPENSVEEEPPEEVQELLVTLSNPIITDADTISIYDTTDLKVEVAFLTDRHPSEITFTLTADFNGVIETSSPLVGTIHNGIAKVTAEIFQHMGFYFEKNKSKGDVIQYSFTAECMQDDSIITSPLLELPKVLYNNSVIEIPSSIFTPGCAVPSFDGENILLDALCGSIRYLDSWPDKELTVYAHSAETTDNSKDYSLSELRAQGVLALLTGDTTLWKKVTDSESNSTVYETILNTLHSNHNWDTNIDSQDGSAKTALIRFQQGFNQRYSTSIQESGELNSDTWNAFLTIIRSYIFDGADCKEERTVVRVSSDTQGFFPCSSLFPKDSISLFGLKSEDDTRVEIHFHDSPNPPQLPAASPEMDQSAVTTYDATLTQLTLLEVKGAVLSNWDISGEDENEDEAEYKSETAEAIPLWTVEEDDDNDENEAQYDTKEASPIAQWTVENDDDDDDDTIL